LFLPFDRFCFVRIALIDRSALFCDPSFLFLSSSLPAHRIPVMRQFLDVMNQAEELPLRIDLLLTA